MNFPCKENKGRTRARRKVRHLGHEGHEGGTRAFGKDRIETHREKMVEKKMKKMQRKRAHCYTLTEPAERERTERGLERRRKRD